MKRSITTLGTLIIAYITFIGAVFFSVAGHAATNEIGESVSTDSAMTESIRPAGTFIPAQCGEVVQVENQPVVSKICMGNLAGQAAKSAMGAFEFRDEKGQPVVYRVTEVSNLLIKLMSGAVRSQVFMVGPNGDEVAMKINRLRDGTFSNASGQIGDAKFNVPQFQPVAVTL